ncbi:hypothetical protein M2103_002369 [Ereboglobus sp. PH5-5]|uniref:fused MFS/spermidine synthase n=1 Tax=Ereboglobus sp. PH5-5 TaxID=2940529 RepID=UPI00240507C6|nr:fused MFS/spermidine synthase [Ereboglobus sp. PH5-5]MDF9834132.1 hypothetical protein [Ereboglobus sp. PH5-5]
MSPLTPIAIFLGSALLFCLQPMVGRTLLPAFGGSAAVWSVCLAAFQVLLVGGYAYAHGLNKLGAQKQRRAHVAMLGVAAAWTFAAAMAGLAWVRGGLHAGAHPAMGVLVVVLAGVGVPYLVLSAGSSLLQAWASETAREHGGRGVYRLYAISNLGSFFGLFAYPFLLDPFVSLRGQWLGWCAGLVVYLALVAGVARGKRGGGAEALSDLDAALAASRQPKKTEPVVLARGLSGAAWWFVLPGLSSFTLVATTNHLSMDVAPMPLLWVILLGAFLLSYAVGFSRAGERWLPVWRLLALGALIACGFAAQESGGDAFTANILAGAALVFFGGVFLHGWLYATRPEGARLTRFYLGVAVGGAVGGMLVSFVAPVVFSGYWEYQVALIACAAASLVFSVLSWELVWHARLLNGVTAVASVCVCMLVWTAMTVESRGIVLRGRNFYGALKVGQSDMMVAGDLARVYALTNGGTMHGQQAHGRNPELEKMPTSYYGSLAGGLSVMLHKKWTGGARGKINLGDMTKPVSGENGSPMRVGVIGLGVGTMATWARAGDEWRFFEINPLVDKVARDEQFFTCVTRSAAAPRTVLGDARLMLEREQSAGEAVYDVLIIDAYSGDSIPLHLATEEAFQLYAKRLAPDGILAMHISNWHLDLLPLCKAAARALGMSAMGVQSFDNPNELTEGAMWVFLTREPLDVSSGAVVELVDFSRVRDIRLPTDERGSLQGLIRFNYSAPVLIEDGWRDYLETETRADGE